MAIAHVPADNEHICPDMLATGLTGSHNPFFTSLSVAADLPEPIKEALISTALGHRILQSSNERPGDETAILATRLQTHRGAAIRTLADALSQPKTQTSDAVIVSIFVFLLSEVQSDADWRLATALLTGRLRSSSPFLPTGGTTSTARLPSFRSEAGCRTSSCRGPCFATFFSTLSCKKSSCLACAAAI